MPEAQSICPWAVGDDYVHYHNTEWGRPSFDRNALFEKLCLEGQQAGLSWITVLRKRAHYRQCFHHFIPEKVAAMTDAELDALVLDAGIIRHKLKIYAIRKNALALLALEREGINFVEFLWQFVDGEPVLNKRNTMQDIPTQTPAAVAMSKALKKAGFTFVGPTICYAFMQSMGLVNDHLLSCSFYSESAKIY